MKKILYLFIFLLASCMLISLPIKAQSDLGPKWDINEQEPTELLWEIEYLANKKKWEEVQNTKLDKITSKACDELWWDSRFTITKTFCYIKNNSWSYLQYVMYTWLAAATIIIIRNWFLLVTSSDREKQMWTFKKNMTYLVIWIILITCFYFILDVFVSVINFIAK